MKLTPQELLESFKTEVFTTVRRRIAIGKLYPPGTVIRWRACKVDGREMVRVFSLPPNTDTPHVELLEMSKLNHLCGDVSNSQVAEHLRKSFHQAE